MAGNEGRTAATAPKAGDGPIHWGKARRLIAALLVAFSMIGTAGVVFAGTASAQQSSDPVLQWLPQIETAASATGIGAEYIAAVIRVESVGDPNAVSSAGAIGLMQVMPAEFQSQGIPESSWFDPATNILAGATEIAKHLAATGSIESALATYFGSGCDLTGTCTDGYIATVLSYAAAYATAIANGTAVDLSGMTILTGADPGYVAPGVPDDSAWQGETPGDGGWHADPPPADPGDGTPLPGDPGDAPDGGDPGTETPEQPGGDTTGDDQPTEVPTPNG